MARKTSLMLTVRACAAFLAFALLVASMGNGTRPPGAAATTYTLTDLNSLGGNTIARGVNTSGHVIGKSQMLVDGTLQLRAFFCDGILVEDPMDDLGALGGPSSAWRVINDVG